MKLTMIPREEWDAWTPWHKTPQEPPAHVVLCSYTETDACRTIAECRDLMQRLQRQHIRLHNLEDLPYNFVIGGEGNVYEGRGWLLSPQLGQEQHNYPGKNLYIGVCGRPRDLVPREALVRLIKFGVTYGLIIKDFQRVHIPHFVPNAETTPGTEVAGSAKLEN